MSRREIIQARVSLAVERTHRPPNYQAPSAPRTMSFLRDEVSASQEQSSAHRFY